MVSTAAGQRIEAATVRRMCQAIVHRGPDEEGIFVKDGIGLGMRRLSIIDLAGGRQPVFNEDRTVWVVFNGEIYNFPELREDLLKRGHRFSTHTDTEVIVHLYEEMGPDCVHKLRGMFAFALYDEPRRRLLMARDRLGKKPLHYALQGQCLLFGSEIKAILAVAPELATVNNEALLQYMYFGYIPDPLTAFTTIQKLPPGHLLEFENGKQDSRSDVHLPQLHGSGPLPTFVVTGAATPLGRLDQVVPHQRPIDRAAPGQRFDAFSGQAVQDGPRSPARVEGAASRALGPRRLEASGVDTCLDAHCGRPTPRVLLTRSAAAKRARPGARRHSAGPRRSRSPRPRGLRAPPYTAVPRDPAPPARRPPL
jgi:hypothetical protein